ncbi:DUF3862 domain-containing protein [Lactobacillus psittaci]|uniref:DUF3862 domain-containing protein n=1 Tax=Lactobacillus psittaci DSM 15354 TaxID=1122152 RepID=A0A0R1S562_9LACO|nr:DUF3862 domain-containing protein [Lactobacillus psittaci]KRL63769.1 hypothetical protein FC23_GL000016 [Lactobacillus psittaci DSM 15354]
MSKVQTKKKPFFKKIGFWILIVILIIIGASIGGKGGNSAKNSSNNSISSSKSSNLLSLANFDKINLSSTNGDSKANVRKLFGKKESSTSSSTIENIKTELLTWSNVDNGDIGSNITINFDNDHAVSKSISGLKVKREKKISLSDFEAIQNGQTKDEIKKKFGNPNGYTITNISGHTSEMWDYTSDIKGELGANFNISFTNDQVSGKAQYEMK